MKVRRVIVAASVALIAAASVAQARECSRPSKPSIPDGKTASDQAMKAAQGKVTSYIKEMNSYLHCMSQSLTSGKEEAQDVSAEWKRQSDIFVHTPKPQ